MSVKEKENYPVTMCVCTGISFAEMKEKMNSEGIETIDELCEISGVASNCRSCLPYIEKMMETGEIKFQII
ncbi:MAG: (2Fe-2S)-binding protein [Bacteroidetes bacterium]|nr:(2Fe-2S)-binding protein [Bacteroidota bacterium]